MSDVGSAQATLESRKDAGDGENGVYAYWMKNLEIAEKENREFVLRGRKIVARFRDERNNSSEKSAIHRFNILWSNVETLTPALYSRTPKADVERRFKDHDPIGKLGSDILERALSFSLENSDFDSVMQSAVLDRLLPGRGTAWIRYVPTYGEEESERIELEPFEDDIAAETGVSKYKTKDGTEADSEQVKTDDKGSYMDGEKFKPVVYEEVIPEYVFWEDFRFSPCRKWVDCTWVSKRALMTRDALIERFGKEIGNAIPLDWSPNDTTDDSKDQPPDAFKKASVWEIWDKGKKQVVWLAKSYQVGPLDTLDDPLGLEDFFPCPEPLFATMTNDNMVPVADYLEYQDQADELDILTARIDRLVRTLKVSGLYAGTERAELQQLVDDSSENKLIPVENWQQFMGAKGGLDGVISWMPIDKVAAVLAGLYDSRDRVKQVLYELTGISDILRGATSPIETLGAQNLKSQYATLRLSKSQRAVAYFARDIIRIMGEIISLHFSPETLAIMTGLPEPIDKPQLPPPPQMQPTQDPQMVQKQQQAMQAYQAQSQAAMQQWQQATQQSHADFMQAVEMLRENAPCPFRIDIEADSTVAMDEDNEKKARTEFLSAMLPLLQQMIPAIQQNPKFAPLAKQIMGFGIRGFKTGKPLESAIDQFFDDLEKQPPQPPQDPKAAMANVQLQLGQQKNQIASQKAQHDEQLADQEFQVNSQVKSAEIGLKQQKLQIEAQNAHAGTLIDVARLQAGGK